uniref:Pyridine nucleotide-disulfide oxidoreductase domain-containing protein 2 n=1 Tax=Panagrellus redivivus TaxID=6233 RepID=A0A7E4UXW8_PANRE
MASRLTRQVTQLKSKYDVVIVGGGHNGLTAAAYLAKAGRKVAVLEQRHILGGAAVTEEIVPGFRFSRASYLLSLFRPQVIADLHLKKHGLRYHIRDPSSFTPIRDSNKSLLLGRNMAANQASIAQFSKNDAQAYPLYEKRLEEIVKSIESLFDSVPLKIDPQESKIATLKKLLTLYNQLKPVKMDNVRDLYELLTAPISKVMNKWFESDVLKATLATDGVIGFAAGPHNLGTGYVLLHHVMGGLDGIPGVWGIVYGGMGSVSTSLAKAAVSYGAELFTDAGVSSILIDDGKAVGVKFENGTELAADMVFSNLTPHATFNQLLKDETIDRDLRRKIDLIDYESPVCKINVALSEIPNFSAVPNPSTHAILPHHQTTIHINCENMELLDSAYTDYQQGHWSRKPAIELTLPSSVDRTIVDNEHTHVGLIFSQYTPFQLAGGKQWTEETKHEYAKHVFNEIDAYAPNFSKSIVGYEVLPPPELQKLFNLTGGNIFHGSMSLDQLYFLRPSDQLANYATPFEGLYLCGSGAHPGGGVTGSPGRLAALTALKQL